MNTQLQKFPKFYVTHASPCPYLPGNVERKVFAELQPSEADDLNDALTRVGFRRSQNVVYRPACENCKECVSVRIRVENFKFSRSLKRILRINGDLETQQAPPWVTNQQFRLLRSYLKTRHAEGGMADMDLYDYAAMVQNTPVDTFVAEYRWPDENRADDGRLVGVCLTDLLSDGLSMVYSFYDPEIPRRSLGTYIILSHIRMAQELQLPYVYLGYWIKNCAKMNYKTRFSQLEYFTETGWISD